MRIENRPNIANLNKLYSIYFADKISDWLSDNEKKFLEFRQVFGKNVFFHYIIKILAKPLKGKILNILNYFYISIGFQKKTHVIRPEYTRISKS